MSGLTEAICLENLKQCNWLADRLALEPDRAHVSECFVVRYEP